MNTEERIAKQKELVEEMGRHFDKDGFQPIAGRILGLLMVMDKEQFTFDEITQELQISKSSASNALRNLEIRGNIEYITLPGDRKRYFHIKQNDPITMISELEEKMRSMQNIFHHILELKADKNSKNAVLISQYKGMLQEVYTFLDSLKRKRNFNK
jgi:DNA-binding transcriptional regulator GbsR (MarR family)